MKGKIFNAQQVLEDKFSEQFWQTLQKKLGISELRISKIDNQSYMTGKLVFSFIKNDQLYGIRVPCNEIQKLRIVGLAFVATDPREDGDVIVYEYRRELCIDEALLYRYLKERIFLIT
jgi:hypothetical protein